MCVILVLEVTWFVRNVRYKIRITCIDMIQKSSNSYHAELQMASWIMWYTCESVQLCITSVNHMIIYLSICFFFSAILIKEIEKSEKLTLIGERNKRKTECTAFNYYRFLIYTMQYAHCLVNFLLCLHSFKTDTSLDYAVRHYLASLIWPSHALFCSYET